MNDVFVECQLLAYLDGILVLPSTPKGVPQRHADGTMHQLRGAATPPHLHDSCSGFRACLTLNLGLRTWHVNLLLAKWLIVNCLQLRANPCSKRLNGQRSLADVLSIYSRRGKRLALHTH
jgi:hypothetical protein